MHFVFSFFKSLKYSAFVLSNQRSLINSSRTIDLRMHSGWYDLPFRNNLLAAVSLAKLTIKNRICKICQSCEGYLKVSGFFLFLPLPLCLPKQKDSLFND